MNIKLDNKISIPAKNSYIVDYLISLGIAHKDVDSFINQPKETDQISPFKLDNMSKGIEMLKRNLSKNMFLVVDSDADGYTSSSIIYNFIKYLNPEASITCYVHENKEHGVIVNTVPVMTDLVIIPDAGSNQTKEIQELVRLGMDVLVLDHHIVDEVHQECGKSCIINNRTSLDFHNDSLSGAGVTFKFIQGYSEANNLGNWYKSQADLAALGIIADMMDTRNIDNNYIIKMGIRNVRNPMILAMLRARDYSVSNILKPNPIDLAFYVAPIINGVTRMGSQEEKERMFKGLTTLSSNNEWYDLIANECVNIKGRQDTATTKHMEKIEEILEATDGFCNEIIVFCCPEDYKIPPTITGLIAAKISNKYEKPTLILRPKTTNGVKQFSGSGRANKVAGFSSFKEWLSSTGLMNFASGHDMAFGASVNKDKVKELLEFANEKLKDIPFGETETKVNYLFNNTDNFDMVKCFGENKEIYGNTIPEPVFAFDMEVETNKFRAIGKKLETIKISIENLTFIRFRSIIIVDKLKEITDEHSSSLISVDMIGKASINEFRGNYYPQIILNDLDIEFVRTMSRKLF